MSYRYHPCYCEENALGLLEESPIDGLDPWLLVISNETQSVLMFSQSAADESGVVVWDYHVVVFTRDDRQIWDLDSTAGFPLVLDEYLMASFGSPELMPAMWRPKFRAIPAKIALAEFSSDRSHMLDPAGNFLAPPPAWPPIINGPNTFMDWVDLSSESIGVVLDRDGLRQWAE